MDAHIEQLGRPNAIPGCDLHRLNDDLLFYLIQSLADAVLDLELDILLTANGAFDQYLHAG